MSVGFDATQDDCTEDAGCTCSCHDCAECGGNCDEGCGCECHDCCDECAEEEEQPQQPEVWTAERIAAEASKAGNQTPPTILGPDGRPARRQRSLNYHEDEAERIRAINADIQDAAGTDFNLEIRQTPIIWAAFDGNNVLITTGCASILDDDELAGVLAHEHAHGYLAHIKEARSRREQVVEVVVEIWRNPNSGFFRKLISSIVQGTVGFLYVRAGDRRQELEADGEAARIMVDAGYEPAALVRALNKASQPEEMGFLEEMISTHPPLRERRYAILHH